MPAPRMYGSFAVYVSSYSSAGLNPALRQMRVGSGVPGNGVVRQSANAQSVLAIAATPVLTPAGVSAVADVSLALAVSRLNGVRPAAPAIDCVLTLPGMLTNRSQT